MYVGAITHLLRHKFYREPRRLARAVWCFISNPRGQMELLRIFSLPAFRDIVLLEPVFPFRHLSRNFLLPKLTGKMRTASILHHYRFLIARSDRLGEVSLLEHESNGRQFAVTLGLPVANALLEGESLLQLQVDGTPVYRLQFTIVPGRLVHSEQRDVIFVQRLQGAKGCFEQISVATRAFADVAPPLLLVSVLEGIAAAWGIHEMACISGETQLSCRLYNEGSSAPFREAYDDFLLELGARPVCADFFSLPLPLVDKPIDRISNGHKARTRRKRAFRHEIANRVCQTILGAAWPQTAPAVPPQPVTTACSVAASPGPFPVQPAVALTRLPAAHRR